MCVLVFFLFLFLFFFELPPLLSGVPSSTIPLKKQCAKKEKPLVHSSLLLQDGSVFFGLQISPMTDIKCAFLSCFSTFYHKFVDFINFNCILFWASFPVILCHCYKCYFKCVCVRVGFDKQLLDCHARIYLDISHSLQLCHLMAGAVSLWSTGMGGSSRRTRFSTPALSLPHTPLPFCLSLSICVYFCWFTLSASSMHTVHTKANLVQYDTYMSYVVLRIRILFSQHGDFLTIVKVDLFLVLLVGWYCLWLLPRCTVVICFCIICFKIMFFIVFIVLSSSSFP